jgi:hypothetical protein
MLPFLFFPQSSRIGRAAIGNFNVSDYLSNYTLKDDIQNWIITKSFRSINNVSRLDKN